MVSVRANVRTAAMASHADLPRTMRFAFRAGSVTGLGVVGLATLELVGCHVLFRGDVLARPCACSATDGRWCLRSAND
jgi:Na+/H+-translocating membrane pyrophosphatase